MDLTKWTWIIVALGAPRAMQIVLWDRITRAPRHWLQAKLNPQNLPMNDPNRGYLSYLLECPWCMSIWIGAAIVGGLLWDLTRAATLAVLAICAISLVAVLVDRIIDRALPDEAPEPQPQVLQVAVEHEHEEAPYEDEPPPAVARALANLTGADTTEHD